MTLKSAMMSNDVFAAAEELRGPCTHRHCGKVLLLSHYGDHERPNMIFEQMGCNVLSYLCPL